MERIQEYPYSEVKHRISFLLAICLLSPILLTDSGAAGSVDARWVQLAVDVRYYYGRWQWGDFKMTPRAGMAGPDLRLELQEGRWVLSAYYLSGDFAAVGATPLADPVYHSRKNFELTGNREDFEVGVEFHPWSRAGIALIYKLVQYDLVTDVDLNSDQRLYGSGREQVVDEAWGWGIGLLPRVPLGRGFTAGGEIFFFPTLTTKAAGSYRYDMLFNSDRLDERWFGRTEVSGFRCRFEFAYELPKVPISLSLGYFFQRLADRDSGTRGWLEEYLAGQTQTQSWEEDLFQGVTARAGFTF